jgi:hypothetical protein
MAYYLTSFRIALFMLLFWICRVVTLRCGNATMQVRPTAQFCLGLTFHLGRLAMDDFDPLLAAASVLQLA